MRWADFYADQSKEVQDHQKVQRVAADALYRRYEEIGEALEPGMITLGRLKDYIQQSPNEDNR